jgi:hypothetical protein
MIYTIIEEVIKDVKYIIRDGNGGWIDGVFTLDFNLYMYRRCIKCNVKYNEELIAVDENMYSECSKCKNISKLYRPKINSNILSKYLQDHPELTKEQKEELLTYL